jgi:hypothetical protein
VRDKVWQVTVTRPPAGEPRPDGVGRDALGELLDAAAAPGRAHELSGMEQPLTVLRQAGAEQAPRRRGRLVARIAAATLTTKIAAVSLVAAAVGGTVVAGATGHLPGEHVRPHHAVPTSGAPDSGGSGGATRPGKSSSGTPSTTASSTGAASTSATATPSDSASAPRSSGPASSSTSTLHASVHGTLHPDTPPAPTGLSSTRRSPGSGR